MTAVTLAHCLNECNIRVEGTDKFRLWQQRFPGQIGSDLAPGEKARLLRAQTVAKAAQKYIQEPRIFRKTLILVAPGQIRVFLEIRGSHPFPAFAKPKPRLYLN